MAFVHSLGQRIGIPARTRTIADFSIPSFMAIASAV